MGEGDSVLIEAWLGLVDGRRNASEARLDESMKRRGVDGVGGRWDVDTEVKVDGDLVGLEARGVADWVFGVRIGVSGGVGASLRVRGGCLGGERCNEGVDAGDDNGSLGASGELCLESSGAEPLISGE